MALPHKVKRKELSLAIKPIITGHGVFSWKIFLTIMKPETYVALPLKTSEERQEMGVNQKGKHDAVREG